MVKIQKNFKSKLVHNNFGFFSDSVNPDPMISGFLRIQVIRKKGFGFFPDLGNPEKRVSVFFRIRVIRKEFWIRFRFWVIRKNPKNGPGFGFLPVLRVTLNTTTYQSGTKNIK